MSPKVQNKIIQKTEKQAIENFKDIFCFYFKYLFSDILYYYYNKLTVEVFINYNDGYKLKKLKCCKVYTVKKNLLKL